MLGLSSGLQYHKHSGKSRVQIYGNTFNDVTGFNSSSNYTGLDAGWIKHISVDSGDGTLYGSTVTDNTGTAAGWMFKDVRTGSSGTGTGGGMISGLDAVSGVWSATGQPYLYYEATSAGSDPSNIIRSMIGMPSLDFGAYEEVQIEFWFHAYGSGFGSDGGVGIAVTDSATSASSADQVGAGLGFTSDTEGGAEITYTNLSGTVVNTKRFNTQVQTGGGNNGHTPDPNTNYWIKAIANINNASGVDGCRIWFGMFTSATGSGGTDYKQDFCIDNIKITGLI
tara:strand:- start:1213 stop:2055 length:843 start_codon:yes stop_codon:yes gene_type:complete